MDYGQKYRQMEAVLGRDPAVMEFLKLVQDPEREGSEERLEVVLECAPGETMDKFISLIAAKALEKWDGKGSLDVFWADEFDKSFGEYVESNPDLSDLKGAMIGSLAMHLRVFTKMLELKGAQ